MAIDLGAYFSSRVVMRADTAGGPIRWANTHEWGTITQLGGTTVDVGALAVAMIDFHRALLNQAFFVESITISTPAEDGKPYNPDTFYALTAMLRGNRGVDSVGQTAILPLVNVLHCKRAVMSGREGNMLLRGYLQEGDIVSDPLTGSVVLVDSQLIPAAVAAAWTDLVNQAQTAGAKPAMFKCVNGTTSQEREVTGLLVKGITDKKLNNKYFDKKSGTLGGIFDGVVKQYGADVVGAMVKYLIDSGGNVPLLPAP